jgi:hypothetical protein
MRNRSLAIVSITTGLAVLIGAGCGGGEEADPEAVNARLRDLLPGVVDPTSRSIEFAGESTSLAGLGDSMAAIDDSLDLPFSISPIDLSSQDDGAVAVALPEGEESGAEVADSLAERLFTADNYEGDGVYRIPVDMVCAADDTTGEMDPECVEQWERAELRIKVELVDDGLDFTLLVGPDRAAPLALELRPARVTVVSTSARRPTPFASSPRGRAARRARGVAAFSLVVNGPDDVSFGIAVRRRSGRGRTPTRAGWSFATGAGPAASCASRRRHAG